MGPVHGNGEYVAELMQELMKLRLPSHRRLLNRLSLLQYGSPVSLETRRRFTYRSTHADANLTRMHEPTNRTGIIPSNRVN